MAFEKGNQLYKKRQRHGRLGYGLEEQKKRLIKKSLLLAENSLDEGESILKEKEKIEKAFAISLKEIGKNKDGDTKVIVNVKPILGGKSQE